MHANKVRQYDKYAFFRFVCMVNFWNTNQSPQLQYSVHISPAVSILSCLPCSVQRLSLDQLVFLISGAIFDKSFDE